MNIATMPHGLERCAGLIWGLVFHDGRAQSVGDDTLAEALAAKPDWVWLHLALSDHRARRFLEGFAPLPQAARTLLLSGEPRIQIHCTETCAAGIVPDVEKDFAGATRGEGRLGFWLDARCLLTIRRHPLRTVDELRQKVEAGLALADPAEALVRLQQHFLDGVETRLVALGMELDAIEDRMLSERGEISERALGPIRRELARHHREFVALRTALGRAHSGRHGTGEGPLAAHLPELLHEAEDFDRDAAALRDRARLLYDEVSARTAASANRSLAALTIISTLLLPPTFVVGAFGMNLDGMPWAHSPSGFALACLLCLALIAGGYAVLRRFGIWL